MIFPDIPNLDEEMEKNIEYYVKFLSDQIKL